nr:hypothetical protein BDOA9_0204380 [Bradyrhizobium sp. DOA9]
MNRKPGLKPGPRKLKPLATYDDKALRPRARECPHRRARTAGGPPADGSRFFSSLARIGAAGGARQARIRIIEVIQAMTSEATDSHADVQRFCNLAGLPRATHYWPVNRRSRRTAECELRDQLQRICLKHPFYGYRRVAATLGRQGS